MERFARLWRLVEHDIPWAVSAFVFAQVMEPSRRALRDLTLRKLVYLAAFLVVAWGAAGFLSTDLALAFAGDTALYIEIASFFYLTVLRGHVDRALRPAIRMFRVGAVRTARRVIARARRPQRRPRLFVPDSDEPDGVHAFA